VSSESTTSARGRFEKSNGLWYWMLFLFSAVFFVMSALRSGAIEKPGADFGSRRDRLNV